ncbi:acyl-CoA dehydrogenase family protein [Parvularcula lutaonensis]|uniref:Acyl-CoA dehydrogenase family protein n=1 Tax=Parvularcula lutaonensis TaxID=491923 RepID=A0ABV7MEE5_9PROT|nr:acyl-CoA dehydrogenase [Parvularcula lutaonensis]GGY54602.1 isovaleryl-CoA dehydrogenase [Parvularcula lutaonensis]
MALVLNDEQQMLQETARGFAQEKSPISELRRLRDEDIETGFHKALWEEMAELGLAGILVPEEHGGTGFGYVGAGLVAQELGRTLAASPYIATSMMAATALNKLGSDDQKAAHLPKIAAGETVFAIASDEAKKHKPHHISMRAERSGNGFKLSGEKTFVAEGFAADQLIVAARTAGSDNDKEGITLFLVDASKAEKERMKTIDARGFARIRLDGVEVDGDAVLGQVDQGLAGLETIFNVGRAGLASEMVGNSEAAFDMTLDYLKQRKQFGTEIGRFQALQHRMAHLYTELEMAKAVAHQALDELDNNLDAAGASVSLAKAKIGQVARLATNEAVQLHGGIGMTDEYDVGFFMKRVRVANELFGDHDFHMTRLAEVMGY